MTIGDVYRKARDSRRNADFVSSEIMTGGDKSMKAYWPLILALLPGCGRASEGMNILDYAPAGTRVDRTGQQDASLALASVISAANLITATGAPACVYLPAGVYRIVHNPPEFARAGCIKGDGPSQTIIRLDPSFVGDLFSWSEAWEDTTPGPTVIGVEILGTKGAAGPQNALTFYDRNDEIFLDNVVIKDLPGRALYSGMTQHTSQAFIRESHFRSLRFYRDGAPNLPVVEFNSQGAGRIEATNEIRMSQVDIFGSNGPSLVIRNNGGGVVRSIRAESLRVEGRQNASVEADLITIGDPVIGGLVNDITFDDLELVDPYPGFAALRMTAPSGKPGPYHITMRGSIGGGLAHGEGIHIDAGRSSYFQLSEMHTSGTNVVIGPNVGQVVFDGGGSEPCWTYQIDARSSHGILTPIYEAGDPSPQRSGEIGRRPITCTIEGRANRPQN